MLREVPRIEVAILKPRSIIHVARAIASPELMPNTGSSIRKGRTALAGYSRPGTDTNLGEKGSTKTRHFITESQLEEEKQLSKRNAPEINFIALREVKAKGSTCTIALSGRVLVEKAIRHSSIEQNVRTTIANATPRASSRETEELYSN